MHIHILEVLYINFSYYYREYKLQDLLQAGACLNNFKSTFETLLLPYF